MYYSYRKIFSYNLPIMAIIGARGIGKTYGAKKHCIKDFIYKDKKFIWMRDNTSAIEELSANRGATFFKDVQKEFPKHDFYIKSNEIFIDKKHAGYLISLSTYYNYKGSQFNEIKNIVFDEFIKEKAQRNISGRIIQFLNMIETIGRTRTDFRLIMLANALDRGDDIFNIFNIKFKTHGYYRNKKKGIVLHYAQNNPIYDLEHKKSIAGKLIQDTPYDDVILNNVFYDDTEQYFIKKPPKCKIIGVLHNSDGLAVRIYYNESMLYITKDVNADVYKDIRFVRKIEEVNSSRQLISKNFLDNLRGLFNKNKVKFENPYIKSLFIDFLK